MRHRTNTKTGSSYNDKRYTEYKKVLANHIKSQYPGLFLYMTGLSKQEKSDFLSKYHFIMNGFARIHKDVGDADNYCKPVMDALEQCGIVVNDKKIKPYFPHIFDKSKQPGIFFKLKIIEKNDINDICYTIHDMINEQLGMQDF